MSQSVRTETELLKALYELDSILEKSQIQTGKGNQPKDWAGTMPMEEDEEDHIAENGTDYDPVSKGMGKKGYEEEDEEMEEEDDEMEKSVQYGVEVSEFLNELTKAVAEYTVMCTNHVHNMVKSLHASQGQIVKSVAHNLEVLDDAISKSHENVIRYSEEPARGPKSITNMSKSVQSDSGFSKEDALRILEKGVMDGKVHPLQVLKVEQLGVQAIDQSILKSLSA